MVLRTVAGQAAAAEEPTARNSNLLPVKAKGLVRLRSPLWRGICGGARVQEVGAGVGGHGPVTVLAAAVDPREGLLVQDALEAEARGDALESLHDQHLVVAGDVGGLEDRGQLELAGGDLVVAGLDGHA